MSKLPSPWISHWPDYFSSAVKQIRAPLIANSIYLMAGSFGSAALAFIFWILAARLIASEAVGIVVAANSAINILVLLSDLGLGSGIVRYASFEKDKAVEIINSSVAVVWVSSVLLGIVFLIGVPLWSPGIGAIRNDRFLEIGFVLFTAVISLLNLQVAAMLSRRRGSFSFWRYSISSLLSIPFLLILAQTTNDVHAAFLSYNIPNVLIFLTTSILIMPLFFNGYRIFGHFNMAVTLRLTRFASANYIATLLWQVPLYALPLIASNVVSAEETAYFYLPWIIAISVISIPQLVSISLFAEGSYNATALFSLVRKASLLILILVTPIILVLWLWGGAILAFIGKDYANVQLLRLILISIIPYTINMIFTAYLRVSMQLKRLVALSIIMSISVLGLAYTLGSLIGSAGLAIGWLAGQTIASISILAIYGFDHLRSRRGKI
jgi:O-antigen/teichoic acid export membrane protein